LTERLLFIGVSTGGSSIMRLFPGWAALLGLNAGIEGCDLPVRASVAAVRAAVDQIARDPRARGALVTTHKVDVYSHAADLFAVLDDYARLCKEVSCISKRDGALVGHAKDPLTAGMSLEEIVPAGHWESGGHVLCLGAGGAGTAITVRLLAEPHPPARIVVAEKDVRRLEHVRAVHEHARVTTEVHYALTSGPGDCDALLEQLPEHSLVVNATGMGKDVPGSPLTSRARFPLGSIVWELNYRGGLEFLNQARAQQADHALAVHDGWRYFLYGWTAVISEVFELEIDTERFALLAEAAEPLRPSP
jgi:shikimate 5-dehydrogenase